MSTVRARDVARDVFSRHAASYRSRSEDVLARGGDGGRLAALELLDLRPGMRVLDVACGPGTITFAILDRVAPSGRVVAVDLAAGMLELAGAEAERRQAEGISFVLADLASLGISDGSFDAVYSAHGLHFAPDLLATLTEFARVLRPNGRIAASFPAMERKADHPIRVLDELVVRRLGPAKEMADTRQTREILDDPDRLRTIAARSGLTDVEITRVEQSIDWPDADVLVSQAMMCWWASASRLEQLEPPERQSLLDEAAATIRRHYGSGSLSIPEVNRVLSARTVTP